MTDLTNPAVAEPIGELTYVRVFDAPPELVFRCMTSPEHLTHFWGPNGVSTPVETISVDLRPGGRFETVMVDDATGATYPTSATYVEIVEPTRLVWVEPESGMTTTSTFEALDGGRTEVRIHQTNVPAMFRSAEAQAGFTTSLDRFAAYLATSPAG